MTPWGARARRPDASHDASPLTERALKWAAFLAATGVVIYVCLRILSPVLNVIAWSSVLAITFHPFFRYLARRTGHAAVSALMASALVAVAFVIPLLFVAALAIDQFLALEESFQRTFTADGGVDLTTTWGQVYDWLSRRLGIDASAIAVWARQHATELTRMAAQYAVVIATSVTGALVSFVFIIFSMFLMFRDGERMIAQIPSLLPFERTQSEALLLRIRDVIYGGVYGVVMIGLIQGVLCGAMFWALGIPSPALWGMVTVLTSALPIVGAAAVWVPGTLYLLLTGAWAQAAILAASGTIVISGVDNFLRPKLVGGRVGLSELVVFVGVLGGLQLFGVLGMVLGPVVFALAASLVDVLKRTAPPTFLVRQ
jgi:predicted PurR-regulated permease PerM